MNLLQSVLPVIALVVLATRMVWAFRQAHMKRELKQGNIGKKVEVATDRATEIWEKKAIGRAKTGGGYVRMPYNNQGVSKKICFVAPQPVKDTLTLNCEK